MKTFAICFIWLYAILSGCAKRFVPITDPAYAIGVVNAYNGSTYGYVDFHYSAQQKTIYCNYPSGHNGWNIPTNANIKTGDMFMVQYSISNMSDARMLFCYKVNDSTDYNNYIASFATTAPNCK
jgi:hypothetical protein